MISIDPKELDTKQLHKYLLSSVGQGLLLLQVLLMEMDNPI